MKVIQAMLMVLLGFMALQVQGQDKDYKGHIINEKGQIFNNGVQIGMTSKEGIIKNADGQKIAFMDGQGNLVDAKTGMKMGKMGKDGKTYYNAKGELQFRVNTEKGETCDIFDKKGNKIGNVHQSFKGVACALHCFDHKLDSRTHKKMK
ncbi:hypothetical protein LV89_04466 [Arcicella aurantiaca]|uniref:MORN repeat protein n=1 Tax=Arcicella aurantiaca TaxID=591202 RepID=A0A316E2R8_9BACT|nr:hypothetical protein [Arcicella aurantiaca]PWK17180.1 hypothetical protein LV89_04466 [Arcicella aurantiaca]